MGEDTFPSVVRAKNAIIVEAAGTFNLLGSTRDAHIASSITLDVAATHLVSKPRLAVPAAPQQHLTVIWRGVLWF